MGARSPVKRVFEDTGHAVIIFGRGNHKTIRRSKLFAKALHRGRQWFDIEILIKMRKLSDIGVVKGCSRWHRFCERYKNSR